MRRPPHKISIHAATDHHDVFDIISSLGEVRLLRMSVACLTV